jgi:hypothetical protein
LQGLGESAIIKGHKREKVENPFSGNDFEFRPHFQGFQAVAKFDNGFGVSVIPELDQKHYEVAVLRDGKLSYNSGLTTDVFRHQTVSNVHDIVRQVKELEQGFKVPYIEPSICN